MRKTALREPSALPPFDEEPSAEETQSSESSTAQTEEEGAPEDVELRDRSERILMEVCGVGREKARALLDASGGAVKLAIVMELAGVPRDEAERRLAAAGGVVRRVLRASPPPVPPA